MFSRFQNKQTEEFERTSDSLNEGLPIKIVREKFQRKRFLHGIDSRFNSLSICKSVFFLLIRQVPIKIWVENSVFAIQHKGYRKRFTEVLPPSPMTKIIVLHTLVVLYFIFHIKMA